MSSVARATCLVCVTLDISDKASISKSVHVSPLEEEDDTRTDKHLSEERNMKLLSVLIVHLVFHYTRGSETPEDDVGCKLDPDRHWINVEYMGSDHIVSISGPKQSEHPQGLDIFHYQVCVTSPAESPDEADQINPDDTTLYLVDCQFNPKRTMIHSQSVSVMTGVEALELCVAGLGTQRPRVMKADDATISMLFIDMEGKVLTRSYKEEPVRMRIQALTSLTFQPPVVMSCHYMVGSSVKVLQDISSDDPNWQPLIVRGCGDDYILDSSTGLMPNGPLDVQTDPFYLGNMLHKTNHSLLAIECFVALCRLDQICIAKCPAPEGSPELPDLSQVHTYRERKVLSVFEQISCKPANAHNDVTVTYSGDNTLLTVLGPKIGDDGALYNFKICTHRNKTDQMFVHNVKCIVDDAKAVKEQHVTMGMMDDMKECILYRSGISEEKVKPELSMMLVDKEGVHVASAFKEEQIRIRVQVHGILDYLPPVIPHCEYKLGFSKIDFQDLMVENASNTMMEPFIVDGCGENRLLPRSAGFQENGPMEAQGALFYVANAVHKSNATYIFFRCRVILCRLNQNCFAKCPVKKGSLKLPPEDKAEQFTLSSILHVQAKERQPPVITKQPIIIKKADDYKESDHLLHSCVNHVHQSSVPEPRAEANIETAAAGKDSNNFYEIHKYLPHMIIAAITILLAIFAVVSVILFRRICLPVFKGGVCKCTQPRTESSYLLDGKKTMI